LIYNDFRFPLLIDRQQNTAHLASPGGREIDRKAFVRHLRQVVSEAPIPWTFNKSALLDMLREAK
jgi:leucyl/phenylalanyl-tRNA---protein transferase